ncbi:hypothetical protein [Acidovorax delafieldii]|uniref:hypothetical protein n=1 Tax=Acidovorax delafieldii TaxID=47920 RepID=UPI003ECDCB9C
MTTKYTWNQADSHGRDNMAVVARDWTDEPGIGKKLVLLTQKAGSMNLQFEMTQPQARQMAMALIAAAESLA